MARWLSASLLLGSLFCVACEGGFASPAKVDSLRVFAVKTQVRAPDATDFSDNASGIPGGRIRLELIGADGGIPTGGNKRPLQAVWIGGCNNPPTRQFYACYPFLNAAASAIDPEVTSPRNAALPRELFSAAANADLSAPASIEGGTAFEFDLPPDILSAAPHSDRDAVHFGVSFVFFAICTGVLETRPQIRDALPLACVDPLSRRELGAGDFVTGFTTVYTYEGTENRNQNPKLSRLTLGRVDVEGACTSDADCPLPADAEPGLTRRCNDAGSCVVKVPRCTPERCSKYLLEPRLLPESADVLPGGDHEIVWANFYANAGQFGATAQLMNDRSLGLIKEPGSFFTPPKAALPLVELWLTIDDQRGGTDYRHFSVEVAE
ncbi:MAG: hypothetical protein ACOY0T_37915 [Myxococcota bacterium]